MGRNERVYVPGMSMHVIQRGLNHMPIVHQTADYEIYLAHLRRAAEENHVAVHGYVVMTTHIHLLVTPAEMGTLSSMMQSLGARYTKFFNRSYQRSGTLWNGRYSSFLVDTDRYWLTCLRYIEQNPVRANMVSQIEEYRWSSYSAHAFGNGAAWLATHPLYESLGPTRDARQAAYRVLCGNVLSQEELVQSRHTMAVHAVLAAAS
jgi:putative transposase